MSGAMLVPAGGVFGCARYTDAFAICSGVAEFRYGNAAVPAEVYVPW
jgi:hypothetical protein